ncbi:deoxyribose-phosphate aldolase [candidate division TA06 bacterium]|nr:deoxyribose-phosphate aldolase [candidate division TA06 bacterium]
MIESIANVIDQTLLKPEATQEEIKIFCHEALKYDFAAVCINPYWVPIAVEILRKSGIKVSSVVGFPLGATTTKAKVEEATFCLAKGAREIEMVMNIGALKSGDLDGVLTDIGEVVDSVRPDAIVKVILETHLLTQEEMERAALIARDGGAQFVKTSTGFGSSRATVEDVALLRSVVGEGMGVKASGGIRTYAQAMSLLRAGANRIGTSSGAKIVAEEAQIEE